MLILFWKLVLWAFFSQCIMKKILSLLKKHKTGYVEMKYLKQYTEKSNEEGKG